MKKLNIKHEYDLSLNLDDSTQTVERALFFQENEEIKEDDGGFDCAGTVGTFGSAGGCAGTFGSFGCCC